MAENARRRVDVLGADDVPEVVSVLVESFFDYPVMQYVLGTEGGYAARLERLVAFFVRARVLRSEIVLGIGERGRREAAALVSFPGGPPAPAALTTLRTETWASLGEACRVRYESFTRATAPFAVAAGHLHLNMIGVRRASAGQGLGRALLEAVHALSRANPSSEGVSLTTEEESNVRLYEHFGYVVLGGAPVAPSLTTWAMYRRDQ